MKACDRIKSKMGKIKELVDQQIQCRRLSKRNKKVEDSIRKKFRAQDMDVNFED